VAVAGPIGFVGLVVPHAVRFLVGQDYRWVLPYAALLGATFLVLSDVAARLVLRPTELPVGVMTALIGGPLFVYLVRWRVKR
jgi:iron complex transport system permease protein